MVLGFLILVISSTGTIESWEVSKERDLKLIETRGIFETGALDLYKEKFPETLDLTCKQMHETRESPFAAIILYRTSGRLLCMGTIIDRCHILTAKGCYDRADAEDLLVVVGYYKAWWGNHAQVVPVTKILRHEYAVALLKLKKEIKFTEFVKPVKLPTSYSVLWPFEKHYGPPYKVLGYPVDRYDVAGEPIAKRKRYKIQDEGDLPFDDCKANFSKLILDQDKLFCTMPNGSEAKPFCWGGMGGPVLKQMPQNSLVQVGMAFSHNCTDETSGPLLNVRIDHYAEWIKLNSYQGHSPK